MYIYIYADEINRIDISVILISNMIWFLVYIYIYMLPRSWVRISLEAKYLQHLSAQLIHYIPPYLSTV